MLPKTTFGKVACLHLAPLCLPAGLPFAMDLYLSLASVCCSLIGRLYAGPRAGADEVRCQQLLNSELLQR